MAWDMKWYDDNHTILLFTVGKGSNWDDFHVAMSNYAHELEASSQSIHAIIYDEYGLPAGNPMPHFRSQMKKIEQYRNAGLIITVSPNASTGFLQSIVELTGRFLHAGSKKGVFVKTIEAAIKRIQQEQAKVV